MAGKENQQGRPKLSALEKAKSRAARDYRAFLHTFTGEFEDEVDRKHVQFYESDERMGRPPLTLKQHRAKAEKVWDASWQKYVEQCEADGVDPESPKQLERYKIKDKAGRRGNDRIIYLLKYIRDQERAVAKAEAVPDAEYDKAQRQTRGRRPMTKLEKVAHYREKAKAAELEVVELIANLPRSEQLYYKIHDLKVERRQTNMCITKPDNPQALSLGLSAGQARKQIKELDTRIGALEMERAEALKKEKPKKRKQNAKTMTPNERSEKARQVLQEAYDNASDEMRERGDKELEDLEERTRKLSETLRQVRAERLQKQIEEQERELRELGIDPDQVVNG